LAGQGRRIELKIGRNSWPSQTTAHIQIPNAAEPTRSTAKFGLASSGIHPTPRAKKLGCSLQLIEIVLVLANFLFSFREQNMTSFDALN
jgi:hypothetical protein